MLIKSGHEHLLSIKNERIRRRALIYYVASGDYLECVSFFEAVNSFIWSETLEYSLLPDNFWAKVSRDNTYKLPSTREILSRLVEIDPNLWRERFEARVALWKK